MVLKDNILKYMDNDNNIIKSMNVSCHEVYSAINVESDSHG